MGTTENPTNNADQYGWFVFTMAGMVTFFLFAFCTNQDKAMAEPTGFANFLLGLVFFGWMMIVCLMGAATPFFCNRKLWEVGAPDGLKPYWSIWLPIVWAPFFGLCIWSVIRTIT